MCFETKCNRCSQQTETWYISNKATPSFLWSSTPEQNCWGHIYEMGVILPTIFSNASLRKWFVYEWGLFMGDHLTISSHSWGNYLVSNKRQSFNYDDPVQRPMHEMSPYDKDNRRCIKYDWLKRFVHSWHTVFWQYDSTLDRSTFNAEWWHYNDVILSSMASKITSPTIVYSTVYSDTDKRKHQSSATLAFVRGIRRWPVNSPHRGPVTRKKFTFDDVIMDHALAMMSS